MTSQTLREARKYEEVFGKMIKKEDRPAFHLSSRTGWMNDPNGFSYYKGMYHLFHQYYPYDCHWGTMHWAHAVSRDLLHWEYLPAALAPDECYDRDGCFSGSAIELPDGRHLLMYTGVMQQRQSDGEIKELQTQCLAVGDGEDYIKYECNPVLTSDDLPEGSSSLDFRDPKMWKGKDGSFYCVVGSRPADGSGQILLYRSEDGFDWKFKSILDSNRNRYGKMWECPDFFELDGKWILMVSPQYMYAEGLEYINGNGTMCIIGDFDSEEGRFLENVNHAIDYGIDFYAPQTVLSPDGRRIMIGWMQNWDTNEYRMENQTWFGQMTIPRELSVKNNRLYQKPVRELEQLRCRKVVYEDVEFTGNICLDDVKGRKIDMELLIRPGDEENLYHEFAVQFAQNDCFYTALSFRPGESILKIDRTFSGAYKAVLHQRCSKVNSEDGQLKLRMILDRYSVEIFINDGEQTMTATIYTDQSADRISFFADGKVNMDVIKYDLSDEV